MYLEANPAHAAAVAPPIAVRETRARSHAHPEPASTSLQLPPAPRPAPTPKWSDSTTLFSNPRSSPNHFAQASPTVRRSQPVVDKTPGYMRPKSHRANQPPSSTVNRTPSKGEPQYLTKSGVLLQACNSVHHAGVTSTKPSLDSVLSASSPHHIQNMYKR